MLILPQLSPTQSHLGGILASFGASFGLLDPPLGPLVAAGPSKNIDFPWVFEGFWHLAFLMQLRLSCPLLGHLDLIWGRLGAILSPSWALLGPSWALLGPPWGHPGALLGLLRATLDPPGGPLGPSWGHLGA